MTRDVDASSGLGPKPSKFPDAEWKRLEPRTRVDRARVNVLQSLRFRLFVNPERGVEAFEVLDWLNEENVKPDPDATVKV